jgi:hypothetical protein
MARDEEAPMTRILRTALLAIVGLTLAAPIALADSAAWRTRTMDCGPAGSLTVLLPPSEFVTAFVPFHDATTGAVLVPFVVTVNGNTFLSKPLAGAGAVSLVTCEYVDPLGLKIRIVGLLTPAG